ncbi:hypothetical protein SEA_KILLIGREW_69 [Mycobacterium phage Killigrew]|nr:hypothetical protein SEA_KILLIGREW_69 [Mycobacterium phage Killigrew]
MTHLRVGDRVALAGTGREGVVADLTSSPGWMDQARVVWDDGEGTPDWPPTSSLRRI